MTSHRNNRWSNDKEFPTMSTTPKSFAGKRPTGTNSWWPSHSLSSIGNSSCHVLAS